MVFLIQFYRVGQNIKQAHLIIPPFLTSNFPLGIINSHILYKRDLAADVGVTERDENKEDKKQKNDHLDRG